MLGLVKGLAAFATGNPVAIIAALADGLGKLQGSSTASEASSVLKRLLDGPDALTPGQIVQLKTQKSKEAIALAQAQVAAQQSGDATTQATLEAAVASNSVLLRFAAAYRTMARPSCFYALIAVVVGYTFLGSIPAEKGETIKVLVYALTGLCGGYAFLRTKEKSKGL